MVDIVVDSECDAFKHAIQYSDWQQKNSTIKINYKRQLYSKLNRTTVLRRYTGILLNIKYASILTHHT